MAYQTYTTDVLVIGSVERASADRVLVLFTRDAGLVHARAVSVRQEKSKLRYALQEFSRARVSLVRGKQGWRVIGAEQSDNLYFSNENRHLRSVLLKVIRLVRRLVRGEEAHPELFDTVIDGITTLATLDADVLPRAERVLMLRIVSSLGYVAPRRGYEAALEASTLAEALAIPPQPQEESVVRRAIDEALVVSQL